MVRVWWVITNYLTHPETGQGLDKIVLTNQFLYREE